MLQYYVEPETTSGGTYPKRDTVPALEPADGLVVVLVPDDGISKEYFLRNYWHYRILDDAGNLGNPGNLLDISTGAMLEEIRSVNAQNKQLQTDVQSANDAAAKAQNDADTNAEALMEMAMATMPTTADPEPAESTTATETTVAIESASTSTSTTAVGGDK